MDANIEIGFAVGKIIGVSNKMLDLLMKGDKEARKAYVQLMEILFPWLVKCLLERIDEALFAYEFWWRRTVAVEKSMAHKI